MKDEKIDFIPIIVSKEDKVQTWYIDVRNMSLQELICLRKELLGYDGSVVRMIDSIIYDEFSLKLRRIKKKKIKTKKVYSSRYVYVKSLKKRHS